MVSTMTKVVIHTVGRVPDEFVDFVQRTLETFYRNAGDGPLLVEVYVYASSLEKRMFLEMEALELGVVVVGDFTTLHEAWRGWPRIHVDYERCRDLDPEIIEALLLHEAVHSILHGSIASYIIEIDSDLATKLGFDLYAESIYLACSAIKDYEVCRYMIEKNMHSELVRYAKFVRSLVIDQNCSDLISTLQVLKSLASIACIDLPPDLNVVPSSCKPYLELLSDLHSKCLDLSSCANELLRLLVKRFVEESRASQGSTPRDSV